MTACSVVCGWQSFRRIYCFSLQVRNEPIKNAPGYEEKEGRNEPWGQNWLVWAKNEEELTAGLKGALLAPAVD
jgi:hypothetical protein